MVRLVRGIWRMVFRGMLEGVTLVGADQVVLFRFQHGQVGEIRMVSGYDYFVFGECFGVFQVDADLFFFLRFDTYEFLQPVAMHAQALDGHVVLAGRDGRDLYAMVLVGGINLVDDAGAGVVIPVENDQDGIGVLAEGSRRVELEFDAPVVGGTGCGSGLKTMRLRCSAKEQAG